MKNDRLLWIGGLAAGAAALVGVGVYMTNKAAAAATAPAPAGSTATSGTYAVQVQPGNMAVTANGIGQPFEFDLPAGASWTDNSANITAAQAHGLSSVIIPSSGSTPGTAIYSGVPTTGGTVITLNWTDSAGTAQTTTVTFS